MFKNKCLALPLLNLNIKKAQNRQKKTLFILFVIHSLKF